MTVYNATVWPNLQVPAAGTPSVTSGILTPVVTQYNETVPAAAGTTLTEPIAGASNASANTTTFVDWNTTALAIRNYFQIYWAPLLQTSP